MAGRRSSRALTVLWWGLGAVLLLALVAPLLLPVATPYRLVVVDGGSMEPTYAYGDVLMVETELGDDRAQAALSAGSVVVVGDEAPAYTHRVVSVEDGVAVLRGDANAVDDPMTVTTDDLYGVPAAHLGGLAGDVARWGTGTSGRLMLGALLVLLALAPSRRGRHHGGSSHTLPAA